jgi:hypothetical protein
VLAVLGKPESVARIREHAEGSGSVAA